MVLKKKECEMGLEVFSPVWRLSITIGVVLRTYIAISHLLTTLRDW